MFDSIGAIIGAAPLW